MLYEAVVVEKPNVNLVKWIKTLIFTHTLFSLYSAYYYEIHHVTNTSWWLLLLSWIIFGIIVPFIGLKASTNLDKSRLKIFSAIEWFVGFWNIITSLSMGSTLAMVVDWCNSDTCLAQFETMNHSCAIQIQDEIYNMDESFCDEIPWHVGTTLFYGLVAYVSCMGSISARTMNNVKLISAVSVNARSVPDLPNTGVPIGLTSEAIQSEIVEIEE